MAVFLKGCSDLKNVKKKFLDPVVAEQTFAYSKRTIETLENCEIC